ncbi:MAG TPA: translation initiation factor IF-2 N-terminal domain-containing protein, partial [Bacillota bacterium]|nr:translation initiation factor IF-2 N-terminal domain-containing protein [Bacillota bacterium]
MNKIRIYELAKELGVQSKELIAAAKELNINVNNHMSSLEDSEASAIKKHLKKDDNVETPKPIQAQQPKKRTLPQKPQQPQQTQQKPQAAQQPQQEQKAQRAPQTAQQPQQVQKAQRAPQTVQQPQQVQK